MSCTAIQFKNFVSIFSEQDFNDVAMDFARNIVGSSELLPKKDKIKHGLIAVHIFYDRSLLLRDSRGRYHAFSPNDDEIDDFLDGREMTEPGFIEAIAFLMNCVREGVSEKDLTEEQQRKAAWIIFKDFQRDMKS